MRPEWGWGGVGVELDGDVHFVGFHCSTSEPACGDDGVMWWPCACGWCWMGFQCGIGLQHWYVLTCVILGMCWGHSVLNMCTLGQAFWGRHGSGYMGVVFFFCPFLASYCGCGVVALSHH